MRGVFILLATVCAVAGFSPTIAAQSDHAMTARIAPTLAEVKQYATNAPNSAEVISQSLYDLQSCPSTTTRSVFDFFRVPVGAGTSVFAAGARTFADTNIESMSGLPEGIAHLATSLEFVLFRTRAQNNPNQYATGTFVPLNMSRFIEDFYNIVANGVVSLLIGEKRYLLESHPWRFPPSAMIGTDEGASISSNSATAGVSISAYYQSEDVAESGGMLIDPPILIPPKTDFGVRLEFLPWQNGSSTFPFTIGFFLNGYRYRYSQ